MHQKTNTFYRIVMMTIWFYFLAGIATAQEIYRHDFGTEAITGKPYTVAPVTLATGLSNSSWTTNASAFIGYTGATGQALSLATTSSAQTYTLTLVVASGYVCNITSFNFWRQRSNTGPSDISMKINGVPAGPSFSIPTTGSNVDSTSITGFNNLTGTVNIELTMTGGTGGTFRLDDFVLNGSVLHPNIQSAKSGNWNDDATWVGNVVPADNQTVLINTSHTVRQNVPGLVRNDTTFVNGGFQMETGSWVNSSGKNFIYGPASTLIFNTDGLYGVNAGDIFWPWDNGPVNVTVLQGDPTDGGLRLNNLSRIIPGNLTLSSGVSIAAGEYLRVNGSCQINQGGWVKNPLQYGPTSTLIYNTNTNPYNNGNEWTPSSSPANVIVKNNTTLNYPANGAGDRTLSGSLTIEAGSALYMDYGTPSTGSGVLTIGDLHLYGQLSLGNLTGNDLKTTGNLNFYSGYNINFNNRAVFFIKDGTQSIHTPAAAPITFPYIVIGRTGGSGANLQMNQSLTVSAPNAGNAISFINASDVFTIQANSLTVGNTGVANQITGPGSFVGSNNSIMVLRGNGSVGTIRFTGSAELASLTVDRTAAQVGVTLGSSLTLHTALSLTNGHVESGSNNLTLRPSAVVNGGSANSYVKADGSGQLVRYFNNKNQWVALPVGGSKYSPLRFQITGGTLNSNNTYLSANLAESRHPQNNTSTSYINRYWNTSVSGLTGYLADVEFNYVSTDVVGTESNIISGAYDGSLWQMDNPANTVSHFISFTGTDNLGRSFTGGNTFSPLASQPTNYFRSITTGNWNATATWQSSYDNITWSNATLFPTSQAKGISIRNSHTVSLTANATARLLTVETGGTLTNFDSTGGHSLSITNDGTSADDFKIYGTYILSGKQPIFGSGAKARVYTGGLVRADYNYSGGSDNFAKNPNVFFETNAVFDWNTTNAFGTSNVTYFPNSTATDIPVFRVSKNPGAVGAGSPLTINGVLQVNADFTFVGGSTKTFRNGITGNSTLTQDTTGGNRFVINGSNAILGGSGLTLDLKSQMNLNNSVLIPKDSSVIIKGYKISNNVVGNVLSIEGILDVTNITITNTVGKTIILEETGLYRTEHPGGFTAISGASIGDGGTVILKPGSTVELYSTGNQALQSRSDFSNLIFSGGGVKLPSSGFNATGTLTIKDDAILDSRGKNIGDTTNHTPNLTMLDNSRLIVSTTGRNPFIDGVYNLQGGVIQFDNNSITKQTIRNTTSLPVSGTSVVYNQVEVTGTNVGNGSGNLNLRNAGKFTVKSGGSFEININSIKAMPGTSNQQVIVESGATFKTGNPLGFHSLETLAVSSINPNITDIILHPNSTVDYHRSFPLFVDGNQIITGTIPYQNLTLSGNQTKTAQAGSTIEIKGDLNKPTNTIFEHNDGTVIFSGTGMQSYFSAFPQMVFNNLTNQNTIGLDVRDSLFVLRALTLGSNSKLNLKADITLRSNAISTANLAPVPSTAQINYDTDARFIVERYIPNHSKAWQFISTPVIGTQTIHQAWMEGMNPGMSTANNMAGAPGNLKPGYGTTITSDRATWQADGFDRYTQPGPSLKTFNTFTGKWEGVSSTSNPIQNAKGYMLFVRGDRSIIDHTTAANATTLRSRGQLYAPATAVPPVTNVPNAPGLFVSVGNPYASALNFSDLNLTNVANAYTIWDPQLTTYPSAYGLGAYRTISGNVSVPSSGNYQSGNIPPIQSGQAFFVQLSSSATGPGTVSFTENAKTNGSRSIFRGGSLQNPDASLRINLFASGNGQPALLDGNLIQYHSSYANSLDEWDARKMMNPGENIGIMSNQHLLAIERRMTILEQDTVFYKVSALKKQSYLLEVITERMDYTNLKPYLFDAYTDTRQELDPSGKTWYPFEITENSASFEENRFKIIFKSMQGPLPVTLTSFTGVKQNGKALLKWTTENASGIKEYSLERSIDGKNFVSVYTVPAQNNPADSYQFTDVLPAGNTYYRLEIRNQDGSISYSNTIRIDQSTLIPSISIYPNPVVDGRINLNMIHQAEGKYRFKFLNTSGQTLLSNQIQYTREPVISVFDINTFASGMYYLEINGPDGEKTTIPVIK